MCLAGPDGTGLSRSITRPDNCPRISDQVDIGIAQYRSASQDGDLDRRGGTGSVRVERNNAVRGVISELCRCSGGVTIGVRRKMKRIKDARIGAVGGEMIAKGKPGKIQDIALA